MAATDADGTTDVGGTAQGRLDDPLAEALRIVDLAEAAGLHVRMMGGLAFHAKAPTWTARIDRSRRDIDLATRSRDVRALAALLAERGYVADRQYNALHGHKQLYFLDRDRGRPVDVLVDRLEMCHRLEFRDRLAADRPTLPLTELLLSKLQIVRLNRKDALDALVLFAEYPVTEDDTGIDARRIAALTARDWGWWRTATMNLGKLVEFLRVEMQPDELDMGRPSREDAAAGIGALLDRLAAEPKSVGWKVRAKVGDRVPWYEEPEEIEHPPLP